MPMDLQSNPIPERGVSRESALLEFVQGRPPSASDSALHPAARAARHVRLVLIEPNEEAANLFRSTLDDAMRLGLGLYEVTHTTCLDDAEKILRRHPADVVVVDLDLVAANVRDGLHRLGGGINAIPIMVLATPEHGELLSSVLQAGVQDYICRLSVSPALLARCVSFTVERWELRRQQRACDERFRRIIQNMTDGVLVVDAAGRLLFANAAAEKQLGQSIADKIDQPFDLPIPLVDGREVCLPRPAAGHERVAVVRVVETEWEGQIVRLAVLHDVTAPKRNQDVLRFLAKTSNVVSRSLEWTTTLASLAKQAVPFLADWCLVDVILNGRAIHRIAGAVADSDLQIFVDECLGNHPLTPRGNAPLLDVIESRETRLYPEVDEDFLDRLAFNVRQRKALQALGCSSALIVPLPSRERALGAITLVRSVPARRYKRSDQVVAEDFARRGALAAENSRLYQDAQMAVRQRDEFLAVLAHELRNPLAPIVSAAHIIRVRAAGDATLDRASEVVERQSEQLTLLLNDLLDLSRVMHRKIALRLERVDLAAIVANAVENNGSRFTSRGQRLRFKIPDEPVWVRADAGRLEQVLANLLNNAAKYTGQAGQVRVCLRLKGKHAILSVRDTGVGIAAEMLTTIFEPFSQAQHSLDRSEGGLGIGLTLVKSIVELHGGRIRASSKGLGHGSQFVVRLPMDDTITETARDVSDRRTKERRRILIVEDSRDGREMLRDLLELYGHQVIVAADGLEGLEAIRRHQPEVALIDVGLPGMDGYQLAQAVRGELGPNGPLLIALTGYGRPEDRRTALASGFHSHFTKPLDVDRLHELLEKAR